MRLIIDEAGRVVIPKPVRDEMHLNPGDLVEMENSGREITLRPVQTTGTLTQREGVWVLHAGQELSADDVNQVVDSLREERDRTNGSAGE